MKIKKQYLEKAVQPKFQIDDLATVSAGYVSGMRNTAVRILAIHDTRAYTVSYMPTNGEQLVVNYKWIVQEEIVDSGKEKLKEGKMVLLNADHSIGMEGAKSVIEASLSTTAYKVEYLTTSSERIKHQGWLIEDDLIELVKE
ncbi:hypothetical protein ATZ33_14970 [Enterococcus silesiacus]|uniref:DUF1541 domain-containing protein n=1 Tax=Enterococcus silesiacus TaxID=332949 RepID=A0A0S3KEF4_9ENTE|nr:DUF1541 domain-containing protein [Enterococcus silesiacus]ALS02629.1 hypothetical protein ATZ33_14970 [Enterococcus silesiacus]OJG93443.1 hypothetical protein RV15_GL000045 [Enterococcus silesiacus]